MNSSFITIRGTRLYVEQYNEASKDVLLYLHGGPGSSCIDFCFYQAKALSDSLRVIALDQRGVLRSDPIQADEPFGVDDIIKDLEELRNQLGVDRWNLLGHSFGGYLAVKYALDYPDSIRKIVFESPCFDVYSAARSIISKANDTFKENSNPKGMEQSSKYLSGDYSAEELWNAIGGIFEFMGEDKDLLYFNGITPDEYGEIMKSRIPSNEMWSHTGMHTQKLQDEGKFFENLMPQLSQIPHPTLLITGAYDPVCCHVQQQAYQQHMHDGKRVLFEHSAHFPRLEEPEKYTHEVLSFILG